MRVLEHVLGRCACFGIKCRPCMYALLVAFTFILVFICVCSIKNPCTHNPCTLMCTRAIPCIHVRGCACVFPLCDDFLLVNAGDHPF